MFTCQKVYGHDVGLSCVFRQHRAESHCNLLHGYSTKLDDNGWVLDFGSLKNLKAWLQDNFDHTLIVAADDPMRDDLLALDSKRLANVIPVKHTGCEAFAKLACETANRMVSRTTNGRVQCLSCTVSEHGANSATYTEDRPWVP